MNTENQDLALSLQAVIDTAIDGIITISKDGIIEMINPAAAKLFGYSPKEIVNQNISILMPDPDRSQHDAYIERYNRTKEPRIIGIGREVQGLKKNGTMFPFRLAVSEVILNNRIIFTGIIHDLSDVKKAEAEIIELNKQLENKVVERTYELEKVVNKLLTTNKQLENEINDRKEIERKLVENELELKQALEKEKELNELKSRFVSMASHEFRTPLASILSSAALIGKYHQPTQQENREKHINRIKKAVGNLTGILNDFLSLGKLEEGKENVEIGEVNLTDLCEYVIQETKMLLKPDQKIIHQFNENIVPVRTDERIVKNILFNLISNAIKYSDKSIKCNFIITEDYFLFEIKDQGIGIPLEDQKYLFTRFFRAGNVTNIQGTGLGLTIVKRYVDLLGGTIEYNSTPEVGSCFTVKIPNKKI